MSYTYVKPGLAQFLDVEKKPAGCAQTDWWCYLSMSQDHYLWDWSSYYKGDVSPAKWSSGLWRASVLLKSWWSSVVPISRRGDKVSDFLFVPPAAVHYCKKEHFMRPLCEWKIWMNFRHLLTGTQLEISALCLMPEIYSLSPRRFIRWNASRLHQTSTNACNRGF